MADGQWYWCLKHNAVEPYDGCKTETRLGPYTTRDEAMGALDNAQNRNEAWDNDPRFNDPDDDEDDEGDDSEGWGPFKH